MKESPGTRELAVELRLPIVLPVTFALPAAFAEPIQHFGDLWVEKGNPGTRAVDVCPCRRVAGANGSSFLGLSTRPADDMCVARPSEGVCRTTPKCAKGLSFRRVRL